jgi:hypothetical protein
MAGPTMSVATKPQRARSRISRLRRTLKRPFRQKRAAPAPAPPVFRHVWREVAPGQWQVMHIRVDDQDTPT